MTYSECVSDYGYYVCPSEYGDVSKTSCCVDNYGRGMCCVPETIDTREDSWAAYQTESPMLYYMDYLLIFGASIILLVIIGLLCCEYSQLNMDDDNLYLIKQNSVTPEVKLSKPHDGNDFRVIREYNRHIDSVPSAPPSYYEEFDNESRCNYGKQNYFVSPTRDMPDSYKLDSSLNQHSYAEPSVQQHRTDSTSCNDCYRPPSYAPGLSSFYK